MADDQTLPLYVDPKILARDLGNSLSVASRATTSPDDESQLREASRRLGIPLESARTNPAETKQALEQDSFDASDFATRFPSSARYLANPDNALIARDDIGPLSEMEKAIRRGIQENILGDLGQASPVQTAMDRLMPSYANERREREQLLRTEGFAAASRLSRQQQERRELMQASGSIGPIQQPEATPGNILTGLGTAASTGFQSAKLGLSQQINDLFSDGTSEQSKQYTRKRQQLDFRRDISTPEFETDAARWTYGGFASLAQTAPAIALSIGTGSSALGLGLMGLQTYGEAYGRYRGRGATKGQASLGAGGEASVEVLTELMPMKFAVDRLGKAGMTEFLSGFLGRDMAGEQIATLAQDAIDTAIANPNKTWADYLAERPEAAVQTAVATLVQAGTLAAIGEGAGRLAGTLDRNQYAADRANDGAQQLQELLTAASASMTRQRDPQSFAQLVQDAAEDSGSAPTELFFDAGTLVEILQQGGIAEDQLGALLPSVAEQLEEVIATNGTLAVPIGEATAAFAGTGVEQQLAQNARISPDAWTAAEATEAGELLAQLEQDAQKVLGEQTERQAWEDSSNAVFNTMLEDLNAAGRFTPDVNRTYATLVRSFYTVQAGKLGTTPQELYDRFPLRVSSRAPGAAADATLEQGDLQRALAMTEDEYIATINPTGKRTAEDDVVLVGIGDLDLPAGAGVVDSFTDKTGASVEVYADEAGALYAVQGGQVVGQIENQDGETLNIVAQEVQGRGIGTGLAAALIKRDPFAPAGSFSPAGEAARRSAFRQLKAQQDGALRQSLPADRNLIVAHNLSAENLRHAVEIGGLAVPSLAITKAETPIQGFGEITLVGGPELATPSAKNPVFDADVYSPRFPDVKVKVDTKAVAGVLDPLREIAKAEGLNATSNDAIADELARNRLSDAAARVAYDDGLRLAYARTVKGESLPVPKKAAPAAAASNPADSLVVQQPLAGVLAELDFANARIDLNSPEAGRVAQALYTVLVNKYLGENPDAPAKGMALANRRIKNFTGEDKIAAADIDIAGEPFYETFTGLSGKGAISLQNLMRATGGESAAAAAPAEVVDLDALREQLDRLAPREEVRNWARKQFTPAMGEKRIVKGGGRTTAYTIENVVKEMTKSVRDAEGFNYGLGNARSKGATRFKNIKQIQGRREQITSKADTEAAIKENTARFNALVERADPVNPYRASRYGQSTSEWLAEVIGDSYSRGVPGALALHEVVDAPAELVAEIERFAADLVGLPTEYFEAKPQRAVGLGEFKGAVVPNDAPQDVRDALASAGLEVAEYQRGDEASRSAAVAGLSAQMDVLFQSQPERARATFNPATLEIALLERADLSSFLHELGHAFLEMQASLAAQPDAPQAIVDDMRVLLDHVGFTGTAAEWLAQPVNARREAHETIAESFEQYLFTGKAPSIELQPVFRRIRAWMTSVYRSVKDFLAGNSRASLNPDVAAVFDHMLAAEDAIASAQAVRQFEPMFRSAEEAGMSPEQWAGYQADIEQQQAEAIEQLQARTLRDLKWLDNAKGRKLKELQKEAAAQRKAVRDEVTAEVEQQPLYRAMEFLKRGVISDDGEQIQIEVAKAAKLNIADVQQMYPEGELGASSDWKKLGYGKYGMLSDSGLHPDTVAEMFGFRSGRQLIAELLNAEPKVSVIDGMTEQRMLERHGDISSPEALVEAANEALATEARARLVATELQAVTKATGKPAMLARAARQTAERIVDSKPVRNLRPDLAAAAATRARKAADKAMAAGDTAAAAAAKRTEILQVQLERVQRKAQQEHDKALQDFKKILKGSAEKLAKSRDMAMVNAARAVLARYGLAPATSAAQAQAYMALLNNYDGSLSADIQSILQGLPPAGDFRDLSVEQFRGMRDIVNGLYYLARRTKQIEIDGEKVELDAVAEEIVQVVSDREGGAIPPLPGYTGTPTTGDRWKASLLSAKASLTRVEAWADNWGPVFKRYIWQPVSEATSTMRAKRNELIRQYRELLRGIEKGITYNKIDAPELGPTGFVFNAGKSELLHAVLHSGNQSNLTKLLLGRGWGSLDANGQLDTRKWDQFITRMINEGVLTKADMDFAQGVWDLLETVKKDAQAAHKEMYGYFFNEVTADPINTQFGQYRGGYVPALADSLSSPDMAQKREQEDLLHAGNSFMFPTTGKGFTQSRVFYNKPLELDLRLIGKHLDKVSRFAYLEPTIRDVGKLIGNKRIARALNGASPGAISDMLMPWLQRTARQSVAMPGKNPKMNAFFNGLRNRTGMLFMFGNVVNTLQQLTGFSLAALKVPAPVLLRATARYLSSPIKTREQLREKSAWLAERMDNQSYAMQDQIEQILTNPSGYTKVVDFARRHAYFLQQAMQNVMDPIIWTGAYDHAIAKGATEREARRYADEAVRTTQGSFAPEDISAFEVQSPFVRLFTQFYGYFNMWGNLLGNEANKAVREAGFVDAAPRLTFLWFAGMAIPAVVAALISQGLPDDEDDEDGDGVLDEYLALFFGAQAKSLATMVPIAGHLTVLAANQTDNKVWNDRLNVSPAVSAGESAAKGVAAIATGEVFDEEMTKNEFRSLLTLLGLGTGLPVAPVVRAGSYVIDVEEGRKRPESAAEMGIGILTGR